MVQCFRKLSTQGSVDEVKGQAAFFRLTAAQNSRSKLRRAEDRRGEWESDRRMTVLMGMLGLGMGELRSARKRYFMSITTGAHKIMLYRADQNYGVWDWIKLCCTGQDGIMLYRVGQNYGV